MPRLINADELVRDIDELSKDAGFYRPIYEGVKNCVNAQPTIDAVPVVRCKDCKHRGNHEVCPMVHLRFCYDGDGHVDEVEDDNTEDDFFCSYGERKDGEG